MTQEEFLLKWNDHHASFFTIVEDLCRTEQLCDVTLACGGQVFETHKLILSVCSPYFRTLLNSRPDKHPIVYLKDVNPKHLEQLLSYMYRGEINVLQEDLGPLIETARGLQIKGLADAGDNNSSRKDPPRRTTPNGLPAHAPTHHQSAPKRARTTTPTPAPKVARKDSTRPTPPTSVTVPLLQITNSNSSFEAGDDEPLEVDPSDPAVKQEMWMMGAGGGEDEDEDDEEGEFVIPPEQYEQDMQAEDEQYIQAGADGLSGSQAVAMSEAGLEFLTPMGRYSCPLCGKEVAHFSSLKEHMIHHTDDRPEQCHLCQLTFKYKKTLVRHLVTQHRVPREDCNGIVKQRVVAQPRL